MDLEVLIWLLLIAIWLISGIFKQIKQVAAQRPGQPGPGPQQPSQETRQESLQESREPATATVPDDPMVQLLRQLGGEVAVRPRQLPTVHRPTPVKATAVANKAETDTSASGLGKMPAGRSESRRAPRPPMSPGARSGRGGAMARGLGRQLRNPRSARRAILLQEILGKPPGLTGSPNR